MPLFDNAFNLVVAEDHPLARHAAVDQKELLAERLLLLEEGHCLHEQALSLCHAAGANQADDFRASSLATVVQMVANGYGSTILRAAGRGGHPFAAAGRALPGARAGAHDRPRLAQLLAARARLRRVPPVRDRGAAELAPVLSGA